MEVVFLAVLVLMMMFTLGIGFPVAFALPGSAILTIGLAAGSGLIFAGDSSAYFANGTATEWLSAGVTNFRGVYWEADRDTLIAIPLFVFMGIMLQRSKIAEELLVTMAKLFGGLPGGLGISVVVVGALLAATTGIVGATVVAMGLISLPAMMRNNYSQSLATGTVLASGTLGQIIPPSIVLIILADQLSSAVDQAGQMRLAEYREATGEFSMPSELAVVPTSAGDMFMGALIPGLVLVGMYIVYILCYALLRPQNAPSVPIEGRMDRQFWIDVIFAIVPPLLLIVLVLGSIISGVATVTQAGAVGAAGATVMAGYKLHGGARKYWPVAISIVSLAAIWALGNAYNLNVRQLETSGDHVGVYMAVAVVAALLLALGWSTLRTYRVDETLRAVMLETAKTSALVFIILLGAAMLISAFRGFGGEHLVKDYLTGLPGGFWGQFIIIMAVIFLLGFFLDFIEIAIVVVPIVAPILLMNPEANVTAIWLGVMIGLNIQTSFLTPPFGFALFYLRGVADKSVKTLSMYKGVIPFILMQLGALVIVGYVPPLVNYLPARISLLSENAPPPRNPRLQYCVEQLLADQIPAQEVAVRALMADVAAVDLAMLPQGRQRDIARALAGYDESFPLLATFEATSDDIAAASPAYRPQHQEVRAIRREVDRLQRQAEALDLQRTRTRAETPAADQTRARLTARIEALTQEIAAIRATIPEGWEAAEDAFQALNRAEQDARRAFRSAAEQSYMAIRDTAAEIAAAGEFEALIPEVEALVARVGTGEDPEVLADALRALESQASAQAGGETLRSALSDLRGAISGRRASPEAAMELAPQALSVAQAEAAWRMQAQPTALPALAALEAETRHTLGLREQQRLERNTALSVARCLSQHRDISLSF
ncbi:TRAP transporter large permease subunit [Roseicitreum antarcticum]|uniref:TRAP transporter, DctM subunit n=1 Tax=Roseicitreum antarcticum TaxID=564137 RepID=A0A1H2VSX9_9RHOB|nr:TRAP transporter large permease subunit [Roseicitreum antarcticum]SDW71410.1 TRAP transporter, DctM subunit [Roseicitreum antarcticum]